MKIHQLEVGPIRTNCYILEDEATREAIIIDAGGGAERILNLIREKKLKPRFIIITHGHFDHVGAIEKIKAETGAQVLIHEQDDFFLPLSDAPHADRFLKEDEVVRAGHIALKVIHTPGHTPGGICLYSEAEKTLFSGDTLFLGTYGRVDLPHSSEKEMLKSLEKLLNLPPETTVFPGHGAATTIEVEKKLFPYD